MCNVEVARRLGPNVYTNCVGLPCTACRLIAPSTILHCLLVYRPRISPHAYVNIITVYTSLADCPAYHAADAA